MKEVHKENPCVACPGHCCFRNLINVTGYDAWVIARELGIKPTDFLAFARLEEPTPYNFKLDGSGRTFYLVLNMNELEDGTRRCSFALDLPRHLVRCGIYSFRPIACRAYPLILEGGKVAIKPWSLCPEGAWNRDTLDLSILQEQLGQYQMEFCIYGYIVSRWNTQMMEQPPLEKLDFRPYVNFVMMVYGHLEEIRREITETAWHEIWNRWRKSMAEGINPLVSEDTYDSAFSSWSSWIEYVYQAVDESISKTFYSDRSIRTPSEPEAMVAETR